MTKAIDEALDVERLRHEAQFLVDRIKELDWCGDMEALARDWNGHVDPPLYRLEKTLAALKPATDERVIELDREFWNTLVEAASQSKWIPKDHYFTNDWVSDCADFLRNGPPAHIEGGE